ncbi:MAG: NADPH-dependent glutamate synthase [Spirochaetales bacterium]|nr:NADPH-dependent glutamate synthase [Spirochaetales bacterium]
MGNKSSKELLEEIEKSELSVKERLEIPQIEMPCQDPAIRRTNQKEVATGYSETDVKVEAARCLNCKAAPCVKGCPVGINIPGFISKAAEGKFEESLQIIKESSLLPAVCGRVCPQELQCMAYCTVGKKYKDPMKSVAIGRIERFVADYEQSTGKTQVPECAKDSGKKIAIIGSGPASLSAAADLGKLGHKVTIFEAFPKAGGVMLYGIPEFRLPKAIVNAEVETLKKMGINFEFNFLIGRTRTIEDLMKKDGYNAVFIGVGAGLPKFMNLPGENLIGVFSANEYLTRANLMKAYDRGNVDTPIYNSQKVAVIGGGNVAMDAARMALRLGAEEVNIIYRRTRLEMPARAEEVEHAEEEGINFLFLTNPIEIKGDDNGKVNSVVFQKYELGDLDESGRRSPVPIEGETTELEMDTVIMALGNIANPLITKTTPDLEINKRGNIVVDEENRTSVKGVYAGGDIVLGAATVILAMGEGRKAAKTIHKDLGM